MNLTTSFNTLGIGPEADEGLAKRAYKAQVRRWHPDQFPEGSAAKAGAEEQLKQINIAYARVKAYLAIRRPDPTLAATPHPPGRSAADGHAPPGKKKKQRSWVNHLFDALSAYAGNRSGEPPAPPYDQPDMNQRKSFGQVLDEMGARSLSSKQKRRAANPAAARRRAAPNQRPYGRRGVSVDKVGTSESPGPVKPVSRVRGIGRSR